MVDHLQQAEYVDDAARATRVTLVAADGSASAGSAAAVARTTLNTLLTAGTDRNIPVGRRSYTVVVSTKAAAGSPTLDGVELPAVGTYSYEADGINTLAAAAVTTNAGDVVLLMELF